MESILSDILLRLGEMGGWAYVAAPALMAAVAILPIPAEAPAMVNGMLFGPWVGTAITWTGAMIGALISFELSRALGRPLATRLIKEPTLQRADRIVCDAGWKGLLVARFIPLIAFTALNWGAGLTPISRWTFVWTTALGILPGAFLFTASGAGMSFMLTGHPWITGGVASVILAFLVARAWVRSGRVRNSGQASPVSQPAGRSEAT